MQTAFARFLVMYNRAVRYKSNSAEKDVSVTTADHFYEAIRYVNWRAVCHGIKEIAVLIVPRKSSKNAALVDSRGAEIKLLRGRSLGSKIVPSAQIVFQGSLVLSEIHERRANQQS